MKVQKQMTAKSWYTVRLSPYHELKGIFECSYYPGEELLDTSVELEFDKTVCTTWENKQDLIDELAAVLKKYMI